MTSLSNQHPLSFEVRTILESLGARALNLTIVGNHASVSLQSSLRSLSKEFEISLNLTVSAYDDSLRWESDPEGSGAATNILVFWVDLDKFSIGTTDLVSHLSTRHQEASSSHNVMMVIASRDHDKELFVTSALRSLGLTEIYAVTDRVFFSEMSTFVSDVRADFQGTSVDPRIQENVAIHVLTHAFKTSKSNGNLKLIVLDLDDTLYEGSLIDDGLEGISFAPRHRALIRLLESAGQSGIVFAMATRNLRADVTALLELKDFDTLGSLVVETLCGFGSKVEMISNILSATNLSPSDALFIDDNSQNLKDVQNVFPEITLIQGGRESSVRSIAGLSRIPWNQVDEFHATRVESLRARAAAVSASKSLDFNPTRLSNNVEKFTNRPEDWPRVWSLINRTNQFNASLSRGQSASLTEHPPKPGGAVNYTAVSHSDAYANNGIVAAVVSEQSKSKEVIIHELVASCRVLGRGLDSDILELLIAEALSTYPESQRLRILWQDGPKNDLLRALLAPKFSYSQVQSAFVATRDEFEFLQS